MRFAGSNWSPGVVRVRQITMDSPLYVQECRLREQALLRPVGLDMAGFRATFPGVEERFEHFVAVVDGPLGERVVGCATLLPAFPESGVGKLMQMAVDPQRQGEGIGRLLVVTIESRAFGALGLRRLFCHARAPARGFYESLGWQVESEAFEEVGIPHWRLGISAPDRGGEDDPAPPPQD